MALWKTLERKLYHDKLYFEWPLRGLDPDVSS